MTSAEADMKNSALDDLASLDVAVEEPEYPREISGVKLLNTCWACPEQYDALLNGVMIGYLRLRHGRFYAAYPDVGGDIVYEAHPKGDGIFDDDEREEHLTAAVGKLLEAHARAFSTNRADGESE